MSLEIAIKNQNVLSYFRSISDQGVMLRELNLLDQAYYNGKPLISDATYDTIRDFINVRFPELRKKVGKSEDNSIWPKVSLSIPMGSLLKENDMTGFGKWYKKYTSGELCASRKIDGSSIELRFLDGKFVRAVTRGDGFMGDDITPNANKMKFPKNIKAKGEVLVRGEVTLLKADFDSYFATRGEKNPRNSAAGAMRRLDGSGCEHLVIIAFDILQDSVNHSKKIEKFTFLQELGFQVPNPVVVDGLEMVQKLIDYHDENRDSLPYLIDGLVFEENVIKLADQQGATDNRPRASRAFKFAAESQNTTLLDVVWQVGKTGALTPVGVITPTTIQGVTISRVMLNNLSYIRDLGLGVGSSAVLIRANDVIPCIKKTLSAGREIEIPTDCPSCGSKLDIKDIKHITCTNHEECPAQSVYRITHYLDTLDVKGMGDKIVERLFDEGLLRDIPDLYVLDMEKIGSLEGVASANILKAYKELVQKSKKLPLPKFIKAISMKGVGSSVTELVMQRYPSLAQMYDAKVEELVKIDGIGDSVAADFVFGIKNKRPLIESLMAYVDISAVSSQGPLTGKVFCFTGFRSSELQEKIEALGGSMSSSVTKATTHLVCANTESLSTKAKDAKDKGKEILSKDELVALVGELV